MAKQVVQQRRVSIRVACAVFGISESCYRYEAKLNTQNEEIADWLLRITGCHRNWGFLLCYYYLRNVNGLGCNQNLINRIYRELELNLRIKPRKRLVRETPQHAAYGEASRSHPVRQRPGISERGHRDVDAEARYPAGVHRAGQAAAKRVYRTVQPDRASICGKTWSRFAKRRPTGCVLTITRARIWHWAVLPQSSGWPWPLSFYFCLPWKTGALPLGFKSEWARVCI